RKPLRLPRFGPTCANSGQMPQTASLAAHEISCQRGGRLLFADLSFALGPGEGLLVTGPNGAGKTSLLRMIAGLLPLHAGRIEGGDESVPLPELYHYVGHLNGIKSALTLRENANFWVDFLDGDSSDVEEALKRFGLIELEDLPAGLLSAGQKRKLALTRLFAAKRSIWLLDEPSVSLDTASVKVLDKAIAQHLAQGGVAVVASHTPLKVKFAHELKLKLEPLP
ncbi:MAG: heme ABC exporter ATP-binding protein CcmA, partial [Methyloceanibacter sp.]